MAASLPDADALMDEPADLPMNRSLPRSPAGYLMELERLTAGLDDGDREMVLDPARQPASRRP